MTKLWHLDIFIEFKLFLSGKCIVLRGENIRGHFELVGQKQQLHPRKFLYGSLSSGAGHLSIPALAN